MATAIKQLPDYEYVMRGGGACGGCPITAALRIVGKAFGPNAIALMTPSCSVASIGLLPKSSFNFPILNVAFATAGSSAAGMEYALEALYAKGKLQGEKPTVFTWIGDGGTYDIGLQAISAAAERNDDIVFICYNNEAYSNTGVQRSGATPRYALTTTTPGGKKEARKNMPLIMLSHEIPYMATASLAYPGDFYDKLVKAKNTPGFKYIEVLAPCYTGWKFSSELMIELGRKAVGCGAWPLFEGEYGKLSFSAPTAALVAGKKELGSLREYLEPQGRYAKLFQAADSEEQLAQIAAEIKNNLETLKKHAVEA